MGDSITSGEGTVGAVYEEDWISAFFSAENTYPRMVADALSLGRGMLLWERCKTMISRHGSRLHPGMKAHQITAKEIETYLQELL